jgi:uncharacterized protein DUF4136
MMPRCLLLSLLSAALLASCVPMTVQHDYDPDIDFSRYRAFTWMPVPENTETAKANLTGPFLEKRIKKSVVEALAGKGYARTDDGPDFLVAYYLRYKRKTDVNVHGHGHGYGYWGPRTLDVNRYKEGTLILDFVDPETQELIWRGWSISALQAGHSPREEQEIIDMAVHEILKRFPPY